MALLIQPFGAGGAGSSSIGGLPESRTGCIPVISTGAGLSAWGGTIRDALEAEAASTSLRLSTSASILAPASPPRGGMASTATKRAAPYRVTDVQQITAGIVLSQSGYIHAYLLMRYIEYLRKLLITVCYYVPSLIMLYLVSMLRVTEVSYYLYVDLFTVLGC